jgi:hypothetical protein
MKILVAAIGTITLVASSAYQVNAKGYSKAQTHYADAKVHSRHVTRGYKPGYPDTSGSTAWWDQARGQFRKRRHPDTSGSTAWWDQARGQFRKREHPDTSGSTAWWDQARGQFRKPGYPDTSGSTAWWDQARGQFRKPLREGRLNQGARN